MDGCAACDGWLPTPTPHTQHPALLPIHPAHTGTYSGWLMRTHPEEGAPACPPLGFERPSKGSRSHLPSAYPCYHFYHLPSPHAPRVQSWRLRAHPVEGASAVRPSGVDVLLKAYPISPPLTRAHTPSSIGTVPPTRAQALFICGPSLHTGLSYCMKGWGRGGITSITQTPPWGG